ncbi:flagellar motor switch phosphatase FliY [Pseudogracilibacillus sp. SE30717A]|uniref:flagellar motor switch phosphatase FliY n=1 Tax=Pseudogracilibacillus sp. SE30717A TaxID=3098293 RepID=UPI00300E05FE
MMDDGMLSQDEIDALLNITDDIEEEEADQTHSDAYLTPLEKDTLGEIGNISLGSSATTLSTLLNQKVEITTPSVSIVKKTGITEVFPYEHISLQVDYSDGFDGENIFLIKAQDAAIISDIMLGGDGLTPKEELTEIELSAVQEAMNQMMGASATSMSTVFNKRVDISPPLVEYEDIDKLEEVHGKIDGDVFVRVSFQLKIGELIDSNIMQLIPLDFAKVLVNQLLEPEEVEEVAATIAPEQIQEQKQVKPEVQANANPERQPAQTDHATSQHIGSQVSHDSTIQSASFSEFETVDLSQHNQRNLDMLLDIPLKVTVELGRTKQTVEDILDLSPGSVLELDKLAGEPVDVLVNNKLIAKGEVVVIDENFGVRVTDIVSQRDRLMKLN